MLIRFKQLNIMNKVMKKHILLTGMLLLIFSFSTFAESYKMTTPYKGMVINTTSVQESAESSMENEKQTITDKTQKNQNTNKENAVERKIKLKFDGTPLSRKISALCVTGRDYIIDNIAQNIKTIYFLYAGIALFIIGGTVIIVTCKSREDIGYYIGWVFTMSAFVCQIVYIAKYYDVFWYMDPWYVSWWRAIVFFIITFIGISLEIFFTSIILGLSSDLDIDNDHPFIIGILGWGLSVGGLLLYKLIGWGLILDITFWLFIITQVIQLWIYIKYAKDEKPYRILPTLLLYFISMFTIFNLLINFIGYVIFALVFIFFTGALTSERGSHWKFLGYGKDSWGRIVKVFGKK